MKSYYKVLCLSKSKFSAFDITRMILYHYYNEPLARYGRYPVLDYIKFRFMGLGLSGMSAHTFMREIRKYIEE